MATKRKPLPPPKRTPKQDTTPKKIFRSEPFSKDESGEKVVIYGESGMGKTTLAALAPTPDFFALDDGSRKILDPRTRKELIHVPDVENFQDMRDALHQPGMFDDFQTIVVDTGTEAQAWGVQHVLNNYKISGASAHNMQSYGYGNGYSHLCDVMRAMLTDFDTLIRQGKNVVILCQNSAINKANPGGEDFIKDGPDLYHDKRYSVRELVIAWADHVVKIDYGETYVKDKKAKGETTRQIFVKPEPHFVAKSRTLPIDIERISFDDPTDDSFWQYLLEGECE